MASVLPVTGAGPVARPVHTPAPGSAAAAPVKGGRFDQVAFSTGPEGDQRFRMELVGRLSQEIRAATTTGSIQELHRQVQGGQYRPDPSEIAARMLLLKGTEG